MLQVEDNMELQTELVVLRSDKTLLLKFCAISLNTFWISVAAKYSVYKQSTFFSSFQLRGCARIDFRQSQL